MTDAFRYCDLKLHQQPCMLCGSLHFTVLATHDRHGFGLITQGCQHCGLVQTNPRPAEADMARFYTEHYRRFYQATESPDASYVQAFRKDARLRYTADHLWHGLALARSRVLLDCGCGEGSLFVALRERGFTGELVGIEPNPQFAAYAQQAARAKVLASIDALDELTESIDNIVLNHVLEHFPNPLEVLCKLRGCLAPEGKLYVDVPDVDRYVNVDSLHLAHLSHFNRTTLRSLIEQAGFSVNVIEPHNPPHHPFSIRLTAVRSEALPASMPPATHESARSWQVIRRIDRQAWRWTARRRLAAVPALKTLYRTIAIWRGRDS